MNLPRRCRTALSLSTLAAALLFAACDGSELTPRNGGTSDVATTTATDTSVNQTDTQINPTTDSSQPTDTAVDSTVTTDVEPDSTPTDTEETDSTPTDVAETDADTEVEDDAEVTTDSTEPPTDVEPEVEITQTCLNNTKEGTELCDGTDLGTATCETQGFPGGGVLACNTTCTGFVTTGCTGLVVPDEWTCPDAWYGDDACDCGCGVKDFDCANTTDADICQFCTNCGAPFQDADCSLYVEADDTTTCLPPLEGENCGDPIDATTDGFTVTVDTCLLDNDFTVLLESAGCESNDDATSVSRDFVVHFVPPTDGTYIAVATPTDPDVDNIINVVADACPAAGTFATCLDGGDDEPPTATFPATAGEDYYIIVDGWAEDCGETTLTINKRCDRTPGFCDTLACDALDNCNQPCGCGPGEACVASTCQAIPGESCAAPTPLVQTGNVWTGAGTLVGATDDQNNGTCPKLESASFTPTGVGTADEVWSFTTTEAGTYRIDLTRGPAGDIYYYVYKGATCDNASCLGYVEAVGSGTETQEFTLEAAQLYTIVVESYSTSQTLSTYTLTVTHPCSRLPGFCSLLACDAVDNCGVPCGCSVGFECVSSVCEVSDDEQYDTCNTAGELALDTPVTYDTCALTEGNDFADDSCAPADVPSGDAVFFFTADHAGSYSAHVVGGDPILNIVFGAACPAPVTTCDDAVDGFGDDEELSFDLANGETVWIFTAEYSDCGEQELTVSENVVPLGDTCSNPYVVNADSFSQTIALCDYAANSYANSESAGCESNSSFSGASTRDAFIQFTPTTSGSYTVTVPETDDLDAVVNVLQAGAACPGATYGTCLEGGDVPAEATFDAVAGQTYFIVVDGWSSADCDTTTVTIEKNCTQTPGICDTLACDALDNCGRPCGCDTGEICVSGSCVEEPGEDCATPKPLVQTGNVWNGAGTLVGATDDQNNGTCPKLENNTFTPTGSGTADEVWSFTTTAAGAYRIDLTRGPAGDIYYYVYKGSTCDNASCLGFVEAVTSGTETQDFTLEAGTLYTIVVESYSTSATLSTYTLKVTSLCTRTVGICDTLACDALDNCGVACGCAAGFECVSSTCQEVAEADYESCDTAGELTLTNTLSVDTCTLASDYDFGDASCAEPTTAAPDAVFTYTAAAAGDYIVTVAGDGLIDPVLNVVVGDVCPDPVTTCTDGTDDLGDDEVLTVPLEADDTVWIFVAGYEWSQGDDCGDIDVTIRGVAPEVCDDGSDNDGDTDVDCDDTDCDAFPACNGPRLPLDVCDTAGTLVLDTPNTFDLCELETDYAFDGDGCAEPFEVTPDAVFTYTATEDGDYTMTVGGNDPVVNVIISDTCPEPVTTCDENVDTSSTPEELTVTLANGETMWVFVTDWEECGEMTITLEQEAPPCVPTPASACQVGQCDRSDSCGTPCTCGLGFVCNTTTDTCDAIAAAPGDSCTNPFQLTAGTDTWTGSGTLIGALDDQGRGDCARLESNTFEPATSGTADQAWTFTTTTAGNYRVDLTRGLLGDIYYYVFKGSDCSVGGECLGYVEAVTSGTETQDFALEAATLYTIVVESYSTSTTLSTYDLKVTKLCTPTPESACGTNSCDRSDSCGTPCTCTAGSTCNTTTDTCEAVAGDSCAAPIEINTETFTRTIDLCTLSPNFGQSSDAGGCQSNDGATAAANSKDALFHFVPPTAGTYTVTATAASFDGLLNVVSGTTCPSATLTSCSASADEPEPMTVTFTATAGASYWLVLDGWGTSDCGSSTLTITKQCVPTPETACGTNSCDRSDSCGTPCTCTGGNICNTTTDTCEAPPPVQNDTCTLPGSLTAGTSVSFNSCALAKDYQFGTPNELDSNGCQENSGAREGVFGFNAPSADTYRITLTGVSGTDPVINVVNTTCPAPSTTQQTCIAAADTTGSGGTETTTVTMTAGQQIYIFASGYDTTCTNTTNNLTLVVRPTTEKVCTGGVDEDGDNQIDCADSDCASAPACATVETNCTDGVDNDGDGPRDCADSDCASNAACLLGNTCSNPYNVTTESFDVTVNTCNFTADTRATSSTAGCSSNSSSSGTTSKDAIIHFTAPTSGTYIAKTVASYDTIINVISGAVCPGATYATCVAGGDQPEPATATFTATAGQEFYIVADSWSGGATDCGSTRITITKQCVVTPGTECGNTCNRSDSCGNVCACTGADTCNTTTNTCEAPPYDNCSTAGELVLETATAFDSCDLNADNLYDGNGCSEPLGVAPDGVFFYEAVEDGTYDVTLAGNGIDRVLNVVVADTCPEEPFTCDDGDDTNGATGDEKVTIALSGGETLWVFATGYDDDDCGDMTVLVHKQPPPVGGLYDRCDNPGTLALDTPIGFNSCTLNRDYTFATSGGCQANNSAQDGIFGFTAPTAGKYRFTLTGALLTDAVLNIVSGATCPAPATPQTCSASGNASTTAAETVDVLMTAGQQVWAVASANIAGCLSLTDNLTISVTSVPIVPGNSCDQPFTLTAGAGDTWSGNGDLTPASVTNDLQATGCSGVTTDYATRTDPDQVFSFTPTTAGTYTITVTPTVTARDLYWYLRSGSTCTGATCIGAVDITSTGAESARATLVAGTTYYIVVEAYGEANRGAYSISVTPFAAVAGDSCDLPLNFTPDTYGTSATGDLSNPALTDDYGFDGCAKLTPGSFTYDDDFTRDEIYTFTAATTATYRIAVSPTSAAGMDIIWALFSGPDCATSTCVGYQDQFGGNGQEVTTVALTAGTTYYVIVETFGTTYGPFTVAVDPLPSHQEGFDNRPVQTGGTYTAQTFNSIIAGQQWSCTGIQDETPNTSNFAINGAGVLFGQTTSSCTITLPAGVGAFSLQARRAFTGSGSRSVTVSVDGVVKGTLTVPTSNDNVVNLYVRNVNSAKPTTVLIKNISNQVLIDNFQWFDAP